MEETDQDDGVNGSGTGGSHGNACTSETAASEQGKKPRRGNMLHDGGTSEAANHEAKNMELQIVRRVFGGQAGFNVLGKANHKTGNADLRANIEELRQHAAKQMPVSQNVAQTTRRRVAAGISRFADLRKVREIDERSNGQENPGDDEIGNANCVDLGRAISLELGRTQGGELASGILGCGQNESRANKWRED